MTKICIPVQAKTLIDLKKKLISTSIKADIIEIWVDHLPINIPAAEIKKSIKKPLLIVNKPQREKGLWNKSEEKRVERLIEFVEVGVKYVDVDISTHAKLIRKIKTSIRKAGNKTGLIISYHNFEKTPSEKMLNKIIINAQKLGADIIKIATYAKKPSDNLVLFNILINKDKNQIIAAMAMGKHGKISRLFAPELGSYLTFVALESNQKSAPGQLTVKEYKSFASLLKTN